MKLVRVRIVPMVEDDFSMLGFLRERGMKKSLAACLFALADLQKAFFVNYLQKDYIKRQLHYQKALNKTSQHFFSAMVKAQKNIKNHTKYKAVLSRINQLSEIVFSLNQLRFRVNDYTTFKICVHELQAIEKYSVLIFLQLAKAIFKKTSIELIEFEEQIHSFESIYNRTLQIVSVDPLVFMFFIQDLYALYEQMQLLQNRLDNVKNII